MKIRELCLRFTESRIWYGVFFVFLFLLPVTSMPFIVSLVRSDVVAAPSGLLLVLLLVLWVLPRLFAGIPLPDNAIPLICFILVGMLSTALSFFMEIPPHKSSSIYISAISAIITLFIGFGFFLVSALWNRNEKTLQFTMRVINWSGFAVLIWTFLQAFFWYKDNRYPDWMKNFQFFLSVGSLYRQRFVGFTLEPSWLAHQLNLLYIPWWFAASITGFTSHRFRFHQITFERILFVMGVMILYLTLSRVGLVAFIMTVLFFVIYKIIKGYPAKKKEKHRAASLLPVLIIILLIPILILLLGWTLSKLDYRMANLFSLDLQGRSNPIMYLAEKLSLAARFVYWSGGINIFNAHPIFGVGLGHAGFFMPESINLFALKLVEVRDLIYRTETLLNIKSLWIRILAETGIVGFSFFLIWSLRSWLLSLKMLTESSVLIRTIGWMGCFVLIAFLLEGFSLDTFALPYLWISIGIVSSVKMQPLNTSVYSSSVQEQN
jgi:O-antigen ligase